jgi:hypothetical protein
MYTNTPRAEVINIIEDTLKNNTQTPTHIKQELITPLKATLEQNYLQFNNKFYKQNDGLAMGAPTSAILSEIFIQYLQHTKIIRILNEHHIIDYYRYVDDILIVYDTRSTGIDNTLTDFNSIHPQVHFTIEKETSNQLNFLDITISNRHNQLKFDIYRKPITTDLIIHNVSCHSPEQKICNKLPDRPHKHISNHT